jgi:hypothetical protein
MWEAWLKQSANTEFKLQYHQTKKQMKEKFKEPRVI